MKTKRSVKWISGGDGDYDSTCGRYAISRRCYSDGRCFGWRVDLLGKGEDYEPDAYIGSYFSECKEWVEAHVKAAEKAEVLQ